MFKAALLLFILAPSISSAAEPLRAVFFDSYAPLSWEEDGKMRGILVDILDETVSKRLHHQVENTGYPWKRAQMRVRDGLADAFVTVPTKARLEYTTCSREPALTVKVGLYTYVDHPRMKKLMEVRSYDELGEFSLVEYIGNGWAKEKFKHLTVEWVPSLEQTYAILAKKRADILVRNTFNFDYFSTGMEITDKIVKLPAVLSSVGFHLCIRKNSPYVSILEDFDREISRIRSANGLDDIFARYRK